MRGNLLSLPGIMTLVNPFQGAQEQLGRFNLRHDLLLAQGDAQH